MHVHAVAINKCDCYVVFFVLYGTSRVVLQIEIKHTVVFCFSIPKFVCYETCSIIQKWAVFV